MTLLASQSKHVGTFLFIPSKTQVKLKLVAAVYFDRTSARSCVKVELWAQLQGILRRFSRLDSPDESADAVPTNWLLQSKSRQNFYADAYYAVVPELQLLGPPSFK
jgi:hypothetical protein